ncbi:MAG TPA: hypothetical protein VMB52_02510 [Verrucomicrobiae bacterium]|nr:hypothetical protein [Verrucomicrobiae bacterium]
MRSKVVSTQSEPTVETIRRYVGALPAIGKTTPLNERAAQAARSALEQNDPLWESRLKAQIDAITREVATHLDIDSESKRYVITDVELRGIIARAVSRTSGQLAVDIGQTLERTTFAVQLNALPSVSDIDDRDLATVDHKPLSLQQEF